MIKIHSLYFFIILSLISTCGISQETVIHENVPLLQVYEWAQLYYPRIRDADLIDEIEDLNIDIIKKNGLPSLSINGKAQYQSENLELVTSNTTLTAPLETWNASVNIDYNIYDGGNKKAEIAIEVASAKVNRTSLAVQLHQVKNHVNKLVFTISLSRKHRQILETSIADIQTNIETLQTGYTNGTVLESEVSKLKVRSLELQSNLITTIGEISTYLTLLERLTGKKFAKNVQFIIPPQIVKTGSLISSNRPEEEFYNNQQSFYAAMEKSITARTLPKISLYAEGGLGNPNPLNFTDFNTASYALGGVKLHWNVFNFGKNKKEKQKLRIQKEQIEIDRQTFLFDLYNDAQKFLDQIITLQNKIINTETIVALQSDILAQSRIQLMNGIITSSEFITQLNARINTEQQLEFHRIELTQTRINYLTLLGQL